MAASIEVMDGADRPSSSNEMDGLNENTALQSLVLSNFEHIVKRILSFLPARRLNTCARVCKLWNTLAQREKKNRRQHYWHFFSFDDLPENDASEQVQPIQECIQNLPIEPAHCVAFITSFLMECRMKIPSAGPAPPAERPKRRCVRQDTFVDVGSYLRHFLPKDCQVTAVAADGVIGTSWDMKSTQEIESRHAMAFLVLGETTGLHLQHAILDSDFVSKTVEIYQDSTFGENEKPLPLEPPIPYGQYVRAMMFVSDESFVPHELGLGLHKLYHQPLIFGGFVDQVVIESDRYDEADPNVSVLAFSGDTLRIASVIIKGNVVKKEEAEEVIVKLKKRQLPEEKSIAFMFACIGRGRGHYGEDNVESTLFRKHFPRTPLLGFFGNGEIGYEYSYPKPTAAVDDNNSNKMAKPDDVDGVGKFENLPPKMFHAYTTILTLMSWA